MDEKDTFSKSDHTHSLPASSSQFPFTRGDIRSWLLTQLGALLSIHPDDISIQESFASYGLSSRDTVTLSGDLERWLQRPLSPTLAWDYPTIELLSNYLAESVHALSIDTLPMLSQAKDQPLKEREPIAIIGIGCRFPGSPDTQAYWQLLKQGTDAISEIPTNRWNISEFYDPNPAIPGKMNSQWGGFVENIDRFDPAFFGISGQEARYMDPQQRLILEVAWEALVDAGLTIEELASTQTGVFVGASTNDYAQLQFAHETSGNIYMNTGSALSIIANRLSYLWNLQGPSMVIDTACSSSLVAVHQACQSLWNEETTLALVGGVNIQLSPIIAVNFTKAGLLAPDGHCKTFDAQADGFVRGEGAGVVILKPLSQAIAHRDPIYAVIKGSALNQDGHTNGLMAPNRLSQEKLLQEAYRKSGIPTWQVQYIETHGTGTQLGDAIELQALGNVLGQERSRDMACAIGSVKTNIGHLEAAAGIAGLIKVALSLKWHALPASLHFRQPSQNVAFSALKLRVQDTFEELPHSSDPIIAGVSSFGFGGTNAHIVLEEFIQPVVASPALPSRQRIELLPLSAHSPAALQALARKYISLLTEENSHLDNLYDLCYTASVRRSHHLYRLAVVGCTKDDLKTRLNTFLVDTQQNTSMVNGPNSLLYNPPLVFVFSGHGGHWPEMGRTLFQQEPVFREIFEQCAHILHYYTDWSVFDEFKADIEHSRLNEIDIVQPLNCIIQISLATLLLSWGIKPDAVVGHSMGEVAAAYIAGALNLHDTMRIICFRSQLLKRVRGLGAMIAVDLPIEEAQILIKDHAERVSIAAHNGPRSIVLSGDPDILNVLLDQLGQQNIFCRRVNIDIAAHSVHMDALRVELINLLEDLIPQPLQLPFHSTVTGEQLTGSVLGATYWGNNLRKQVLFYPVIQQLIQQKHTSFIEINPHPILKMAIQDELSIQEQPGFVLPTMRKNEDEKITLLETLGALYSRGYTIDWKHLYRTPGQCLTLPGIVWQRKQYWYDERPSETAKRLYSSAFSGTSQVTSEESVSASNNWMYQIVWQPQALTPVSSQTRLSEHEEEIWLIFKDEGAVGTTISALLEAVGKQAILIEASQTYQHLDKNSYGISPTNADDVTRLITTIFRNKHINCKNIVYLWHLDDGPSQEMPTRELMNKIVSLCSSSLFLFQSLSHLKITTYPRVWFATCGAQKVGAADTLVNIIQAPLWGFARAAAVELPFVWGGIIDLDPSGTAAEAASHLFVEINSSIGEDQLAFRQGQRYVARLESIHTRIELDTQFHWRTDGTYLITGGLGDLGLLVAHWMISQGARRLLLLSRTPLPERSVWSAVEPGSRAAHLIESIKGLEAAGASIHYIATDVADASQLNTALTQFERESWPPIRGVIHAAGIVNLHTIQDLDIESLQAILSPKVAGGWNLHSSLRDAQLDFFILFSSFSSLLNSPQLSHYAAANVFLDALAHYRSCLHMPALSIDWGFWGEVGMVARAEYLQLKGVENISPQQGIQALGQLLRQQETQVGVLNIDWQKWGKTYTTFAQTALLRNIVGQQPTHESIEQHTTSIRALLLETKPGPYRRQQLEQYLKHCISQVIGCPPTRIDTQSPLGELGIDSLMGLELRNRISLGLTLNLSATLVWNYPTIALMATYLAGEMHLSLEVEVSHRDALAEEHKELLSSLEDLSDEEAELLLTEKLSSFEGLL